MLGQPLQPILISPPRLCHICQTVHDHEVCPLCRADLLLGFGLACGPGFGPYKVCEAFCGWQQKSPLLGQDE